jgi:hypothetical protein
MRSNVASLSIFLVLCACAQVALPVRSVRYAATFGNMEDHLIIDNLNSFIDDDDRVPSFVDFKQGQVQATDNLSLGATIPYTTGLSGANIVRNPQVFNVGAAQFQSQDNYTWVPVTDVDDLVRVRCLYKYVIFQSRNGVSNSAKGWEAAWPKFVLKHCLVSGQITPFRFAPPKDVWFHWTEDLVPSGEDYIVVPGMGRFEYLGTFGSRVLWGKRKEFHDFELSVLGSMPNTTGAAGPAGTSKPPPSPGPAWTLSIAAVPSQFTSAGESLTYTFTVANVGSVPISEISVHELQDLIQDIKCSQTSLSPGEQTVCLGSYTTTSNDAERHSVTINATATGRTASGNLPNATQKLTTSQKGYAPLRPAAAPIGPPSPTQLIPNVYPDFRAGKSGSPLSPPPQPAAQ